MAEWSNAPPWKGDVLERVPRVRIPLSPQIFEKLCFEHSEKLVYNIKHYDRI